jgi:hypothetical protein
MGELKPDEPVFRFDRHTDIDAEASRLARLYCETGMSYAKSIGSYDRLLPLLQSRVEMLGAYPERIAACLYLMGRRDEANEFVRSFLEGHRDYTALRSRSVEVLVVGAAIWSNSC